MKNSTGTAILIVVLLLGFALLWPSLAFVQPVSAQISSASAPLLPAKYRVIDAKSNADLDKQLNEAAAQGWWMVGITFDASRNRFTAVIGSR